MFKYTFKYDSLQNVPFDYIDIQNVHISASAHVYCL